MLNRYTFTLGMMVFVLAAIAVTFYSIGERQNVRPRAQVDEVLSCPAGSVPVDSSTGQCPRDTVPVPIYPSGEGELLAPTDRLVGAFESTGNNTIPGDDSPTGILTPGIVTPTGTPIGICCVPISPTPTIDIPTPTVTPLVTIPVPTSCPKAPLEQTVIEGCSSTERCDFSVADGDGAFDVRPLWSDGTFNMDDSTIQADRLTLKNLTYQGDGDYTIQLTCTDEAGSITGTCTKEVTVQSDGDVCITPTVTLNTPIPTPTIEPPSPTPTGPACRLPIPRIEFRCPNGCVTPIVGDIPN